MGKNRFVHRLVAGLLSAVLLLGSSVQTGAPAFAEGTNAAEEAAAIPCTLTDSLGREVTVTSCRRVAALIGSFADIWSLAGGEDQIVAAAKDAWTTFALPLDEKKVVNIGSSKSPSLEALVESDPDLILASSATSADRELQETLEEMGLTVAYFEVSTLDDYLDMLRLCTELTGCRENYELYGETVKQEVEAARATAEAAVSQMETPPTVLYVRASSSSLSVKNSSDNVLGEMLKDLGTVNIADSETQLMEDLSLEAIMEADPDYIFVVIQATDPTDAEALLKETLYNNPAWESLSAVQNGRIHILDQRLYNMKPNARWGEAYEGLVEILFSAAD